MLGESSADCRGHTMTIFTMGQAPAFTSPATTLANLSGKVLARRPARILFSQSTNAPYAFCL